MKRSLLAAFILVFSLSSISISQRVDNLAAYNEPPSRFRGMIEKFGEDYGSIDRFYTARTSQNRIGRFRQLYTDYTNLLEGINYSSLNHDEQIDFVLFKNYLDHERK